MAGFERIICYGAGSGFHWVEEVFERRLGTRIVAMIDKNFQTLQAEFRIPVIDSDSVEALEIYAKNAKDTPVIIALGNPEACFMVAERLKKAGFHNILSLNEIFEAHLGFQLDDVTPDVFDIGLSQNHASIVRARNQLGDEVSREIFDQILRIYQNKKGEWILSRPTQELHFPPDLSHKIDYSCVVRCGVALDEIEDLLSQQIHVVKELICFEPDVVKFEQIKLTYLDALIDTPKSVNSTIKTQLSIYPNAVYSTNAELDFLSTTTQSKLIINQALSAKYSPDSSSFGSRISIHGNAKVNAVSLDVALKGKVPTFIVADAEGAELEILKGARECIKQFRPALAIALYHRMTHLWEIINHLEQTTEGYEFYLRNYTGFLYETFLYALPVKQQYPNQ
jgi:FkbM family methyltransferase